ncbi:MAG: DUF4416 family protein [Candidatus Aminicenantes bacterium]|nr:DUF4416 family protein [Candidatus Aminicenantes bacterium]
MAESQPFLNRKLIVAIIAGQADVFFETEKLLQTLYGPIDIQSEMFAFEETDYYEKQMGGVLLHRKFISFEQLIDPEQLSDIKITTNRLEKKIQECFSCSHRIVNIDPGILDSSSLIMATVKDFAHRVPLKKGIYGHLELLFGRDKVKKVEWTYPDFRKKTYHPFLLKARKKYLSQIK